MIMIRKIFNKPANKLFKISIIGFMICMILERYYNTHIQTDTITGIFAFIVDIILLLSRIDLYECNTFNSNSIKDTVFYIIGITSMLFLAISIDNVTVGIDNIIYILFMYIAESGFIDHNKEK